MLNGSNILNNIFKRFLQTYNKKHFAVLGTTSGLIDQSALKLPHYPYPYYSKIYFFKYPE